MNKDVFGEAGNLITLPEMSQVLALVAVFVENK